MRNTWIFTFLTVWCSYAPLASCRALFEFVEPAFSLSREERIKVHYHRKNNACANALDESKLCHAEKSNRPQTKFTLWASNDNEVGIGTCPFSRPFPRYSIDLSAVDASGEEPVIGFGWPWNDEADAHHSGHDQFLKLLHAASFTTGFDATPFG